MEHNTVILPLNDYNELNKYKQMIDDLDENVFVIEVYNKFGLRPTKHYYTKTHSEVIERLAKEKGEITEELDSLREKFRALQMQQPAYINSNPNPQTKKISFWDWLNDKY